MADNNALPADEILGTYGNIDNFCLDLLIDPPDEDEEVTLVHSSSYYGANRLPAGLSHPHQLKVPCSNLAIKMAQQNSQVIWKLPNTIFTHPFHIKSSNEAYFSKYVLNCIDTHPPVYQPYTADIFKPAVGDPKQWRHDRAVRMPTMRISATCFPDPCHLKYRPVFVNQPLSVHIKLTPHSHD